MNSIHVKLEILRKRVRVVDVIVVPHLHPWDLVCHISSVHAQRGGNLRGALSTASFEYKGRVVAVNDMPRRRLEGQTFESIIFLIRRLVRWPNRPRENGALTFYASALALAVAEYSARLSAYCFEIPSKEIVTYRQVRLLPSLSVAGPPHVILRPLQK
jgi:hypothetical protein